MYPKTVLLVAIICTFGIFGVQGQGYGNFGRRGDNSIPERGGAFPSNGGYGQYPQNGGFGNNPQSGNYGGFQQNGPQSAGFGGYPQNAGAYPQNSGPFAQPGNYPQQAGNGFRPPRFAGRF
ncbi:unnamed protein product [Chironomus riparius]|uniref:Uncharacterized protein n=1 Tax=Chironomus riparius TaxID=315576 RepID=A0A9N9WPI5_9DIPT|nr:unnamed protein product [Chironomus riparius]